jgi:thiol-disulfide isomerase/thioredoxin
MRTTRWFRSGLTAALTALLFALPLTANAEKIASFNLPRLDNGKQVELANVLGKGPVLVVFWASWCKPCLMEAPHLVKLYEELNPRGLEIVAVNIDRGNRARVKNTVAKIGMPYPVLIDDKAIFATKMGVRSIPSSFLVDAKGEIVKTFTGYYPGMEREISEAVIKLLPAKKE